MRHNGGSDEKKEDVMDIMQKIIVDPFTKSVENLLIFLPNLITSVILLIVGAVISLAVKILLEWLFRTLGMNNLSMQLGFFDLLKRGGIVEPLSTLLAKFTGGALFLVFILIAMRALEASIFGELVGRFLVYLPNVVIGLLILLAGWLLGNFLGRATLIAAVNAGIGISRLVATAVKYLVVMLAATMALEHLGIGENTVEIAFAVLFSGVVFAAALALGLGGKDLARDFLEKRLKGDDEGPDTFRHL